MILYPNGIQGLADSAWSGAPGSAEELVGIDYRSTPGLIKAHQKMTKVSGSVVDELCKESLTLSDGTTLWFSSESGKIWREDNDTFALLDTLSIPPEQLRSMTFTGDTTTDSEYVLLSGFRFSSDGRYYFGVDQFTTKIYGVRLNSAYNLTSADYFSALTSELDISSRGTAPKGLTVSPDFRDFYVIVSSTNKVIQFTTSTPGRVGNATYVPDGMSTASENTDMRDLRFNSDGTELYVLSFDGNIYQYNLTTAYDVQTGSYASVVTNVGLTDTVAFDFNDDGTRLLVSQENQIYSLSLGTAFDITSLENPGSADNTYVFSSDYRLNSFEARADTIVFSSSTGTTAIYEFEYQLLGDTDVTVLGAEEYTVFDGLDGDDADGLDNEPVQYIYFATKNWLFRVPLADVDNFSNRYDFLTQFKYKSDTHIMLIANGRLQITDDVTIAQVNELGVITLESDFNVAAPETITNIENFDVDILIATERSGQKSRILRWDTESTTWYGEDVIYEGSIQAFLPDDNFVYAIVGDSPTLYYYDGERLQKHMRVPGDYGPTKTAKVNRNATAYFMGVPIFGMSNSTGNPTLQGTYSYGQYSKDYSITMDLSFPISTGDLSGVEIGVIKVRGTDVYVSWKTATDVGVDKLDWTQKYNGAYIKTGMLYNPSDRSRLKTLKEVLVDYVDIPTNTSIDLEYSKNYGTNAAIPSVVDEKLLQQRGQLSVGEVGALSLTFTLNTNNNDSPAIEQFHANH